MYLWYLRLQGILLFTLSCLILTGFLSACSVYNTSTQISTNKALIKSHDIQYFRAQHQPYFNRNVEELVINFDLTADFTELFNWNVKHLFLYLSLSYNQHNTVIWDYI